MEKVALEEARKKMEKYDADKKKTEAMEKKRRRLDYERDRAATEGVGQGTRVQQQLITLLNTMQSAFDDPTKS